MHARGVTTRALTAAEFQDTCVAPMHDVTGSPTCADVGIWAYVAALPIGELAGHGLSDAVGQVFRSADGRFDHVAVLTDAHDVFLIVIVDNARGAILGHCLLDLRRAAVSGRS